jgi:hypothetical protein
MRRALVTFFAAAALSAASFSSALADATPVELVLVYMPNVSNTDTPKASGIAELVLQEGEVRVTATDLPHLDDNQQYVAWVLNSDSNQYQRLGAFNASPDNNSVHYENVLPDAIPNKKWNLLLLTVESAPDASRPSNTHSIAGVFPRGDNEPLPGVLPNTGGLPDEAFSPAAPQALPLGANWLSVSGLATLLTASAGTAGYVVGRKQR